MNCSKSTQCLFGWAGAFVAVGLMASTTQAIVVTINSGANAGTVVFDSVGFEDDTVGEVPDSPATGTYRYNQSSAFYVTTGASSVTNGPDSAYAGANYVTVDREASGGIRVAEFSQAIDPDTESFSLEYADWGLGTFTAFSLGASGADGTAGSTEDVLSAWGVHSGGTDGPNNTRFVRFGNGETGGVVTLNVPYNYNAWNVIRYDWDHVEGMGSLTVNGTTVDIGSHWNSTSEEFPATVGQFFFRPNAGGSVMFVDAVPEPASLGLMAGAGLLMLMRRNGGRRHEA